MTDKLSDSRFQPSSHERAESLDNSVNEILMDPWSSRSRLKLPFVLLARTNVKAHGSMMQIIASQFLYPSLMSFSLGSASAIN